MEPIRWYAVSMAEVISILRSNKADGLDFTEVAIRKVKYGPNELKEQGGRTGWQILWEQFTSTMSLILSAAAIISGIAGSVKDSATIFAIVLLFALLGFLQDYRAERAIAALRRLSVPVVRVRRGGEVQDIMASELVPGDIVLLEAGSLAPADCRLLEAHALRVQESLLTGESEAVEKGVDPLPERDIPVGDRRNMLFMGTMIASGRAEAVVTATGMETELGGIATLLQQVKQEWTPLQKRLDRLGKILAVVSVAVAGLIFVVGIIRGEALKDMLLMAVSVAVAAIPEGLPAVVTITLALGAQRMLRRNALIRRLPAVETLGSVTVICSDKTGTLTRNLMTLTRLFSAGSLLSDKEIAPVSADTEWEPHILALGSLCNDAAITCGDTGEKVVFGDPTEGAIISASAERGIFRPELEQLLPRIAEIPFDSTTRRMITVHGITDSIPAQLSSLSLQQGGKLLAAKGAIDAVLNICGYMFLNGAAEPLPPSGKTAFMEAADTLSGRGERVLAIAFRIMGPQDDDSLESLGHGFVFAGILALNDPPRQEAADAVQRCLSAGIRPVMITGDHPLTALAIARKVGIDDSAGVLTGNDLDRLTVDRFDDAVSKVSVYARVAPVHKLRIVESIQRMGGVAAMTGDGVNDAPALKKADVGVAMGKGGTDVAREASDMVLLDDNFATIVSAVEEGRTIYDNIRKFILFSVAGNTGKILVVLLLPFLGLPIPLTPLQLLWLNLLTDGLLGLGMGVERPEPDVMKRAPIASDSQIFDRRSIYYLLFAGLLIGASCMAVTFFAWRSGGPWQTVLFASLAFAQVAQAMALRSFRSSFSSMGLFTNPMLLAMSASVVLLQGAVIYMPVMQGMFRTIPLVDGDLLLVFLPALAVFALLEGEKLVGRIRRR